MIDAVRLNRCKRIETIIVPRCAVGDVQRRTGVVETIRIDDTIVDGSSPLIEMRMPIDV
jgi:hypothetical protein